MSQKSGQVVRRFYEEAFNQGNLGVIDTLFTPDFVLHHPVPGYGTDLECLRVLTQLYRTAFPDLHMSIDDEIAAGDKVAIRFSARGTHLGPLGDLPPSGKVVNMRGIGIYRIDNGRIAEDWVEYDELGMLRQIGAVPAE